MARNELIDLSNILNLIETHRQNAYRKVNEELVTMYYEIGKYLSEKVAAENWGDKTIETIAKGIKNTYPNLKGFNRSGLFRMMQFYKTYKDNSPSGHQPWSSVPIGKYGCPLRWNLRTPFASFFTSKDLIPK